ncbi:hypothetical protein GPM19_13545 [Halomonas sp. ZH2S]|uniref:Minor curlin subunit n=1 Tax=Vreelandella zhuhanensis TaxID=2684210 RepID=A0A7X3KR57_9GAMM|nr:hypothetical protein [Halomonas zhuhanensis]MWJ29204.1 hypothetical protein [Halomonas zhuhanensis]
MYNKQHCPGASQRTNASKVTQAISLCTLGWVVMAFSLSASAEKQTLMSSGVDDKTAQTFITESEVSLPSEIRFSDSRANVALIKQIGDGNTNVINQNRNSVGRANMASIYQRGNANEATITQEGSNNIGLVNQQGNRLEANITQNGNQFESQVQQSGLGGKVNVSQSGSGYRTLTVEQLSPSGAGATATIVTN